MLPAHTVTCARHAGWWIGRVEELSGVSAQERAKPALLASLREILVEALEFNQPAQAAEGAISSGKPPSA
ncbi:MAG: hypothetical protein JWM59_669 [Verrucomicrobiales bacterium]|nr:hypothetical protein [Verrucomicrobiales bacterium]